MDGNAGMHTARAIPASEQAMHLSVCLFDASQAGIGDAAVQRHLESTELVAAARHSCCPLLRIARFIPLCRLLVLCLFVIAIRSALMSIV